jgi:hypothetical protein
MSNLFNQVQTNKSEMIAASMAATLPSGDAVQVGFLDILKPDSEGSPFMVKANKSGAVRYCLLPKSGKGASIKSVTGARGAMLNIEQRRALDVFSNAGTARFNARVASGEFKVAVVTELKTGAETYKLVPVAPMVVKEISEDSALAVIAKAKGLTVDEVKQLLA